MTLFLALVSCSGIFGFRFVASGWLHFWGASRSYFRTHFEWLGFLVLFLCGVIDFLSSETSRSLG